MAINLNGASSIYFRADYSSAIETSSDQLTFGGWFYHDTQVNWAKTIIREDTGGSSKEMYILYHNDSNNLRAFVRNAAGSYGVVGATATYSTSTWYHVVCRYDGAYVRLYVDGVEAGTASSLTGSVKNTTDDPIYFGYDPSSGTDSHDGSMADVFVEKRALSENEIYSLAKGQRYIPTSSTIVYYPCDEPSGTPVDRGPNKQSTSVTGSLTYQPQGDPYQLYYGGVSFVEYSAGAAPSGIPTISHYYNTLLGL